MAKTRILLADGHRLVAEGLRSLLEPDFELVAIVEDGRSTKEAAAILALPAIGPRFSFFTVTLTLALFPGFFMEKFVAELKRVLTFKDDTNEGDLVIVAAKEPQLLVYGVVGPIERDETRRDEWWHVTLYLLGIPLQTVVWTLREPQFTGKEIFTMAGNPHFIKAVSLPKTAEPEHSKKDQPGKKTARISKLTKIK